MKNTFKTFFAVIISIVLFLTLLGGIVLYNIEHNVSKEVIIKTTKEIGGVELIKELGGSNSSYARNGIMDDIYTEASNIGISRDTVDCFLNSETVKEMIGTIIGNVLESVVIGDEGQLLTVEQLNQVIDKAEIEIKENNLNISEEEVEKLVTELKKYSNDMVEVLPTTEELAEIDEQTEIRTIQYLFSPEVKLFLGLSTLVCIILLVLLKYQEKRFLKYIAIPFLILSIFLFFGAVVLFIGKCLFLTEESVGIIINVAFSNIIKSVLVSGIIILFISIICFVCYSLECKNRKNVQKEVTKA